MAQSSHISSELVTADTVLHAGMIAAPAARDIPLSAASRAWLAGDPSPAGPSLAEPLDPITASLWYYNCVSVIQQAVRGVPLRFSRKQIADGRSQQDGKMEPGARSQEPGKETPPPSFPAPGSRLPAPILRARRRLRGYNRLYVRAGRAADEGDLVESGPICELFERPNTYQRWTQFCDAIIGARYGKSGAVAIVKYDLVGRRPGSLHAIDGARFSPELLVDSSGIPTLLGWKYRPANGGGREIGLTANEVVYLAAWSPAGPLKSLSPATPGRLAIATDYAQALFNACALANGGEPGTVIEVPGALSPEQKAEAVAAWRGRYAGPGNAKRTAILEGGAKVNPISSSFPDLQFDLGTKRTRLEICALLHVPPVVAGWIDAAGDSSAYSGNAMQQFWSGVIFTLLEDLASAIQVIVDCLDAGIEAWFDLETQPVVQAMRLSRLEAARGFWGMGVPFADINELLDLGLPEQPWYAIGMLPIGLAPADQVAGGAFPPVPTGDEGGPANADQVGQEPEGKAISNIEYRISNIEVKDKTPAPATMPSEAEIGRLWNASQRGINPSVNALQNVLRGVFSRQQQDVFAAIKRVLRSREPGAGKNQSPSFPAPGSRLPAPSLADVLRIVFDVLLAGNNRLWVSARAIMGEAAEVGIRQALAAAGLEGEALDAAVKRAMSNPAVARLIRAQAWQATKLVSARTRAVLQASLTEGMEAAESINQLADRVQSAFAARRGQAKTIAGNAVGQVYSQARDEGQHAAGFTHKAWIYSRGPGVRRPEHIEAEARYLADPIPIDEPFIVGGAYLRFPRDFAAGAPSETINCHCLSVGRFARQTAREAVIAHGRACENARSYPQIPQIDAEGKDSKTSVKSAKSADEAFVEVPHA